MAVQADAATLLSASGVVRLEIRLPASIDIECVPSVLGAPEARWLGERLPDDERGERRFACDFELGVGTERRVAFRKSAIVSLGSLERTGSGWQLAIEWRAASLAPLFPVFVGMLALEAGRVTLAGYYAPPFGDIGVALDRAALGLGARRVARWFLRQVVVACR